MTPKSRAYATEAEVAFKVTRIEREAIFGDGHDTLGTALGQLVDRRLEEMRTTQGSGTLESITVSFPKGE
jgi:hypothetical protein